MESYGSLIEQLRSRLDEYGREHQWLDSQLLRWIYEGGCKVAKKCECLEDRATIVAVSGTQEYTAPADMIRVHRVEFSNTGDSAIYALEYRDWMNMDSAWWTQQTVTQDTPQLFTMWGFPPNLRIVTYPTPSQAGAFRVFYYRLPHSPFLDYTDPDDIVELTDFNAQILAQLELPEGWHDAALDYAEYMALRKDADPRWQEAKALFEENVQELHDTAIRWTDQAGMISSDMGSVPRFIWDEGYV